MLSKKQKWAIGESMAIPYLEQYGYEIVERNAFFLWGELDIIATRDRLWRCIEVKYRENAYFWYPEEAMTPRKIRTLLRAIELYCLKKDIDLEDFRLDFLGILKLPDGSYEYRLIEDVT